MYVSQKYLFTKTQTNLCRHFWSQLNQTVQSHDAFTTVAFCVHISRTLLTRYVSIIALILWIFFLKQFSRANYLHTLLCKENPVNKFNFFRIIFL